MLRRSPSIGATPGSNAGTRRFAVVDNILAHTADHRRSSGELANPLGPPPVGFAPVADDDKPRPSIMLLILRPPFKHTVSAFKRH